MKLVDMIGEMKNGLSIRRDSWLYEDTASVALVWWEAANDYVFVINRSYPHPKKELYTVTYSCLMATDWEFVI